MKFFFIAAIGGSCLVVAGELIFITVGGNAVKRHYMPRFNKKGVGKRGYKSHLRSHVWILFCALLIGLLLLAFAWLV